MDGQTKSSKNVKISPNDTHEAKIEVLVEQQKPAIKMETTPLVAVKEYEFCFAVTWC